MADEPRIFQAAFGHYRISPNPQTGSFKDGAVIECRNDESDEWLEEVYLPGELLAEIGEALSDVAVMP